MDLRINILGPYGVVLLLEGIQFLSEAFFFGNMSRSSFVRFHKFVVYNIHSVVFHISASELLELFSLKLYC